MRIHRGSSQSGAKAARRFLREDWQTVTVSFSWGDALVTGDPFEVVDEFRTEEHRTGTTHAGTSASSLTRSTGFRRR
jgi:hypothetical protein